MPSFYFLISPFWVFIICFLVWFVCVFFLIFFIYLLVFMFVCFHLCVFFLCQDYLCLWMWENCSRLWNYVSIFVCDFLYFVCKFFDLWKFINNYLLFCGGFTTSLTYIKFCIEFHSSCTFAHVLLLHCIMKK